MVSVGRHARVRLLAGRRVPDLLGEIWCCLVLLLLAVVLWWSEPEAVVWGAAGTSTNKGPFFVRFADGAAPRLFFSWPAMVARGWRRAERVPLEREGGGEIRSAVLALDLMRAGMQLLAASFKLTRRRGTGQPGAGLLWQGLMVVGWRLRSSLWLGLEAAKSWRWWLGEVSPPMLGQRLRFRRLRRMSTAVLQRSKSAIEPQLLFGLRMARFFLRRRLDGGGVRQRAERWWSLKTSRGFFAISCLYRGLFALCHGQVAFGLFLVCAYVCCICFCIPV